MAADQYWVTWKDVSNSTAARDSAVIWGPNPSAPPQLSGYFQAGPFATRADAETYEKAIGTGSITPPAGTPLLGGQKIPNPLTSVTQFLGELTSRGLWVRIMKVLIGGVMIIVGLAQLTGAGKIASNLPKVVPV